jgi:hypothetical protein
MRISKILVFVTIAFTFMYCNKSDDLPTDNIIIEDIDKTITFLNSDSIQGNCKDLIFEILEIDQNQYTTIIKINDLVISCDGFNNILANPTTGKVKLLEENQSISEDDNWKSASGISLDEFAGQGEQYIGYRSGFYPLSSKKYNYGWIKVELTEDKQTLRIINRATNYTDNLSIKAGQK